MKNNKNIIIVTILFVILAMAVGYSAFATQLSINGTAEIVGEWNVKISKIEAIFVSEKCDAGEPEFTDTTASFYAKLSKPGDHITYEITVENAGTIDAILNKSTFVETEGGSPAIEYKLSDLVQSLPAGEQGTFTIDVIYKEDTTEIPEVKTKNVTCTLDYIQK